VTAVLWLLAVQGAMGAFDTLYYHEWRARLPAGGERTRPELRLHATRSVIYAIIFGTLPWLAWAGAWTLVLCALIIAEIVITLWDFLVEDVVRLPHGGTFRGERTTHALMAIVYGAMLGRLAPEMLHWHAMPTGFVASAGAAPPALRWTLVVMAAGVFASGLRDAAAAAGLPGASFPWRKESP
jgi:hypothetical protein